ncbi:YitT family protein [Niallia circulans]
MNGFLVPHHLIDGGILGIALLLHYFFKFPTGIIMVGLSIPICIFSSINKKSIF